MEIVIARMTGTIHRAFCIMFMTLTICKEVILFGNKIHFTRKRLFPQAKPGELPSFTRAVKIYCVCSSKETQRRLLSAGKHMILCLTAPNEFSKETVAKEKFYDYFQKFLVFRSDFACVTARRSVSNVPKPGTEMVRLPDDSECGWRMNFLPIFSIFRILCLQPDVFYVKIEKIDIPFGRYDRGALPFVGYTEYRLKRA